MREFIEAFVMVFIGEMGDKSQFLALAFATTYPMKTVLGGVSLGIGLNHGLAILAAVFIAGVFKDLAFLQIVAGILFLFFGLSALKMDYDDEEEEAVKASSLGPLFTVASAFFVGELGDKTQLMAMTLAMNSPRPAVIFLATVSSMILVSLFGILVGKYLGKKIPQVTLSYFAAFLFILFGTLKLYGAVDAGFKAPFWVILYALILAIAVVYILILNQKARKNGTPATFTRPTSGCDRRRPRKKRQPLQKKSKPLRESTSAKTFPLSATCWVMWSASTAWTRKYTTTSKSCDRRVLLTAFFLPR